MFASQATIGVAIVGFGCLLAILARIRQADVHHRERHPSPTDEPATDHWKSPAAPDNSMGVALPSKVAIACGFLITAAAIYAGLVFAH